MAWPIPADPNQFDEALRFFSSRVIMSADFAAELDAKARAEAFWIGTGLHVERIQDVFREIETALANGEPFEEFRKRVKDKLQNRAHAETVFRNATQRAYNAGRYSQMRDPAVMAARPFWMFDAILDSATTETCRDANGTVLPAEHPWWDANVPPRHHRCRSSIRSLRRRDAERRGISDDGPTEAEPGFGAAPSDDDIEKLKPKDDTDPVIVAKIEKKRRQPRKKKKLPPPPKPGPARKAKPKKPAKPKPLQTPAEHYDPEFWTSKYRDKYGEAATAVGWGRAMYERALDRPIGELAEQARKLADAGHPLFSDSPFPLSAVGLERMAERLGKSISLRGSAAIAIEADTRAWASVLGQLEHSLHIKRGSFPIPLDNEHARKAKAFYETLLDASVVRPQGYTQHIGTVIKDGLLVQVDRPYCSPVHKQVVLTAWDQKNVYAHEWAHAIEFTDKRALERSLQFLDARTRGETPVKLKKLHPDSNYGDDETALPDKFWVSYQGKLYARRATEVTPMGYQAMSDSFEIYEQDEETTWFMLGQLAGR